MTAPTRPRQLAGTRNSPGLLGLREIAVLLDVAPRTPTIWQNRSRKRALTGESDPHPFPEPDGYISGNRPVWQRRKVLEWAKKTGRLPSQRGQLTPQQLADQRRQPTAEDLTGE